MIFPVAGSRATAKAFWPEVAVEASAATRVVVVERAAKAVERGFFGLRLSLRLRKKRKNSSSSVVSFRRLFLLSLSSLPLFFPLAALLFPVQPATCPF